MFRAVFTPKGQPLQYKPVNSSYHELEDGSCKKETQPSWRHFFTVTLLLYRTLQISLLFSILYLVQALLKQPSNNSSQNSIYQVSNCSCGATINEARAVSCSFDVLSLSWLPPSCRDAALTQEFAKLGPGVNGEWNYWADSNGTLSMTLDEVAALAGHEDGFVYTSLRFHVLHCSFYWRKQWRVANSVVALAMEARYARESHVEHCQEVFMLEGSRETGMTKSLVRLGGGFF